MCVVPTSLRSLLVKVEKALRGGGITAREEQHAEGAGRDGWVAAASTALVYTGGRDSGLLSLYALEDVPEVRGGDDQRLRHSGEMR